MMDRNKISMKRRRLMRAAAGVGTMAGLGAYSTGNVSASSTCPEADPNKEFIGHANYENAKGQNEGIYLSTDIASIGAEYEEGVWKYKFKQSTVGRSEEYPSGDQRAAIQSQEWGVSLGTTNNLAPYLGDCYLGVDPKLSSGDDYDYYSVASTIAKGAIANINSYTNYSITAYTLLKDELLNEQGDDGNSYDYHRVYDYYNNSYSVYKEVSTYGFWESWTDGESYFDVMTRLESYYDNNPELLFSFKIYDGYSPQEVNGTSSYSTQFGTEMLSYSPDSTSNHDWQVEKIPADKIRKRAKQGDIVVSAESIRSHENENKPLYWAHNPPVDMVGVSKEGSL